MDELFIFSAGLTEYFYTSSPAPQTYNGQIFTPASITRKEISKDSLTDDAKITAPFDLPPLPLFKDFNPSAAVYCQILKTNGTLLFFGRISNVEFNLKTGTATINLSALGGLFKSKIPIRTYSAECAFELFDSGCGLNESAYQITLPAFECTFSKDRRQVSHPKIKEMTPEYFFQGIVSYEYQHSYITSGKDDTITLMFPISTLSKRGIIQILPGCDKLISTCKDKFNNSLNYGGFPFIPSKNPITNGF